MSKYGRFAQVIVGIELAPDEVARLELDEPVRAGADRLEVRRRLARLGALIGLEQVLRDDHAGWPTKASAQNGVGLSKRHPHGQRVDLLDRDVLVAADGHRGGRRVGGVFPVEDHVVGGERLAVVPLHARLELPDDRLAVAGQAAVLESGNLGGEHRHEVAVGVPAGQRLVEDARGLLVLGADGEVRIEQRRRLPPQQLERTAAAPLGRLVVGSGRRRGDAVGRQHLARQRRGEPQGHHAVHERAAGHSSRLDVSDQAAQSSFIHDRIHLRRRARAVGARRTAAMN